MIKIKRRTIQATVFFMITGIMTGCLDLGSKPWYPQFSNDELSHLYYDEDTLVFDYDEPGFSIYDSLAFLYNSEDTMIVGFYTQIVGSTRPWDSSEHSLFGHSYIDFNEKAEFQDAGVNVKKDFPDYDAEIDIFFHVTGGSVQYIDINKNLPLDTALVLGKTYTNVYKFEFEESAPCKLKRLFFAKKYGFIKVETINGNKLERLDF